MEESNLGWVHTSGSWGDDDIDHGDITGFGNGFSFVGGDNIFQVEDGFVGENQTNFSDEFFSELDQFGHGFTESREEFVVVYLGVQRFGSEVKGFFNYGHFADHQFSFVGQKFLSDLLDLVRGDISESNQNDSLFGTE